MRITLLAWFGECALIASLFLFARANQTVFECFVEYIYRRAKDFVEVVR
jgi:hypothetical protein